MNVPTWLYCKDGSAEIVRDQAKYEARIAEGWKDSPARFAEAADKAAADKAAADKAAAEKTSVVQSPTVPSPAPVEKKTAPAKKKPAAVADKKDNSADDLI